MRSAEFARAGGQTHHHRDVKDAPAPLNAAPEHLEPLVCRQVHVPMGQGRYDRMWTVSPTHAENSAGVLSDVAHVVVEPKQSAKNEEGSGPDAPLRVGELEGEGCLQASPEQS